MTAVHKTVIFFPIEAQENSPLAGYSYWALVQTLLAANRSRRSEWPAPRFMYQGFASAEHALLPVEILHLANLLKGSMNDDVRDAASFLFLQADLDRGPCRHVTAPAPGPPTRMKRARRA